MYNDVSCIIETKHQQQIPLEIGGGGGGCWDELQGDKS